MLVLMVSTLAGCAAVRGTARPACQLQNSQPTRVRGRSDLDGVLFLVLVLDFRHEFGEHPSQLRLRQVQVRVLSESLCVSPLCFLTRQERCPPRQKSGVERLKAEVDHLLT